MGLLQVAYVKGMEDRHGKMRTRARTKTKTKTKKEKVRKERWCEDLQGTENDSRVCVVIVRASLSFVPVGSDEACIDTREE